MIIICNIRILFGLIEWVNPEVRSSDSGSSSNFFLKNSSTRSVLLTLRAYKHKIIVLKNIQYNRFSLLIVTKNSRILTFVIVIKT